MRSGYLLGGVAPDDVVELLVADFPADDTEDFKELLKKQGAGSGATS